MVVYDHVLADGSAHPAFRTTRRWTDGEPITSSIVSWPEVRLHDDILCGSCLHHFARTELNERILRPRDEAAA